MDAGALEKAIRKMEPKGEMTKQIPKGASHLRGSRGRRPRKRQQNHGGELVYSEVTEGRAGGGLDTTRNKHPTKQQQPVPSRPSKHHLHVADRNTMALDSL